MDIKSDKFLPDISRILKKKYSKKEIPWIKMAILEALKSTHRCKHGCVIVNNNKIVGKGHNRCLGKKNGLKTYHAEKVALKRCDNKNLRGASMYIIRLNLEFYNICQRTNDLSNFTGVSIFEPSKPCIKCQHMITKYQKRHNLTTIYYSI